MVKAVKYYLVVFDRRKHQLLGVPQQYADADAAIRARFALETEASDEGHDLEVVVLGAASREALENTHSRYFGSGRELSLT